MKRDGGRARNRVALAVYPLTVGTGPHPGAADRRVDFRLMRGDVRLELREGQPLDDQGRLFGARRARDDGTAIDPVAGR